MNSLPKSPYRIQILPVTYLAYFREATVGAHQYALASGRATIVDRWLPHELEGSLERLIERDHVQGIVVMVHTRAEQRRFARLSIPVINLSNAIADPRLHVVTQDERAVGRMAAEHLRACGCERFAYWGELGQRYARLRYEGFCEALDPLVPIFGEGRETEDSPRQQHRRICRFVSKLPKYTGVFCCREWPAVGFLRAARELGRQVPDDLAILSAGEDDYLALLESTPLSSVQLPAREIGVEGLRLLCNLIAQGDSGECRLLELPVKGLSARRSTDVVMCEDEAVARALRLIHNRMDSTVVEVAKAAGLSRTALQPRFKKVTGCGVRDFIRKTRAEHARVLIRGSDLKLEAVAQQCGLSSVQALHSLVRQHFGCAPGKLRGRARRTLENHEQRVESAFLAREVGTDEG